MKINLPPASGDDDIFYICTKDAITDVTKVFTHQGTETVTQVNKFPHFILYLDDNIKDLLLFL